MRRGAVHSLRVALWVTLLAALAGASFLGDRHPIWQWVWDPVWAKSLGRAVFARLRSDWVKLGTLLRRA